MPEKTLDVPGSTAKISVMRLCRPMDGRVLLTLAFCLGAACGDHHPAPASDVDEYFYECEDPKRPPGLAVFATDESLIALLNKESAGLIKTVDANAATLVGPPAGSALSATTPPPSRCSRR